MAINLHEKYAKQIQQRCNLKSLTSGVLCNDISFEGVRTVNVSTIITVPLTDYNRNSNQGYGETANVGDSVQSLTMTQDKSFSLRVDKGDNKDQNGIKKAGVVLKAEIDEQYIPMHDKYVLNTLAHSGGNIVGNTAAIDKTNIIARIGQGRKALKNAEIPNKDITLFISTDLYEDALLNCPEFSENDKLTEKAVVEGQVGKVRGMRVIEVPEDRWPENVNFIIAYKNSATAPTKLHETNLHVDPPGISGNLLEGRFYYDCFVFSAKCGGIYVDVNTGSGKGTKIANPTITASSGAISSASGAIVKYTLDGTDPRYSKSAVVYSSAITQKGVKVRAYAYKNDNSFPSDVVEADIALA